MLVLVSLDQTSCRAAVAPAIIKPNTLYTHDMIQSDFKLLTQADSEGTVITWFGTRLVYAEGQDIPDIACTCVSCNNRIALSLLIMLVCLAFGVHHIC